MQGKDVVSLVDAQLVGVVGAPRTGLLSADFKTLNGLGINIMAISDALGPMSTGQLAISSAYHLPINEEWNLSTGLRATVSRTSIDLNSEIFYDGLDPSIYTLAGPFIANIDIGTTLNGQNAYFGLSYKNVNRAQIYQNNYTAQIFHLFAGYTQALNKEWSIRTSFLATGTTNSPGDLNLHAFLEHKNSWGLGAHYSPSDEMGMMLKINTANDWNFYYQYNFPLTDLVYITRSSHVVGFSFDIINKAKSLTSPRFFL
jgi:type IX secretion system PorP/SprF family membrane protein